MTRRQNVGLVCGLIALLIAALACFTKPPSPAGRYVSKGILVGGDCYYEFTGGKWSFVYDGGSAQFGTYGRSGDGWTMTNRPNRHGKSETFRIECSWFGISFYDQTGHVDHFRRRLAPGLRPDWMPDWMQ
jgi:hypothetical protein